METRKVVLKDGIVAKRSESAVYLGTENYAGNLDYGIIRREDGEIYAGQLQGGIYHGVGELKHDKTVYKGQFVRGVQHGMGKSETKNIIYTGYFADGNKHGPASVQIGQNQVIKGNYHYGEVKGFSILEHNGGESVFTGFFVNSMLEDIGMEETSKKTYLGQFSNNERHGVGSAQYSEGSKYIGCWEQNKRHGYGTENLQNGDLYEGNFENGRKTGCGKYTSKDGQNSFVGKFEDGNWTGFGKLQFHNGFYFGNFINNLRHGVGYQKIGESDVFYGYWENGKRSGVGLEKNVHGEYLGEWQKDVPHGRAIVTTKDGKKRACIFDTGRRIKVLSQEQIEALENQFDVLDFEKFKKVSMQNINELENYIDDSRGKVDQKMSEIKSRFQGNLNQLKVAMNRLDNDHKRVQVEIVETVQALENSLQANNISLKAVASTPYSNLDLIIDFEQQHGSMVIEHLEPGLGSPSPMEEEFPAYDRLEDRKVVNNPSSSLRAKNKARESSTSQTRPAAKTSKPSTSSARPAPIVHKTKKKLAATTQAKKGAKREESESDDIPDEIMRYRAEVEAKRRATEKSASDERDKSTERRDRRENGLNGDSIRKTSAPNKPYEPEKMQIESKPENERLTAPPVSRKEESQYLQASSSNNNRPSDNPFFSESQNKSAPAGTSAQFNPVQSASVRQSIGEPQKQNQMQEEPVAKGTTPQITRQETSDFQNQIEKPKIKPQPMDEEVSHKTPVNDDPKAVNSTSNIVSEEKLESPEAQEAIADKPKGRRRNTIFGEIGDGNGNAKSRSGSPFNLSRSATRVENTNISPETGLTPEEEEELRIKKEKEEAERLEQERIKAEEDEKKRKIDEEERKRKEEIDKEIARQADERKKTADERRKKEDDEKKLKDDKRKEEIDKKKREEQQEKERIEQERSDNIRLKAEQEAKMKKIIEENKKKKLEEADRIRKNQQDDNDKVTTAQNDRSLSRGNTIRATVVRNSLIPEELAKAIIDEKSQSGISDTPSAKKPGQDEEEAEVTDSPDFKETAPNEDDSIPKKNEEEFIKDTASFNLAIKGGTSKLI